jgi:phosphoribosyl-ATP pyrophosphohydrolase/phosphoribosyl-AMP cyclohydrolase
MKIDFTKSNGLIPVVIQHFLNYKILMLGYMNEEAFNKTKLEGKVTFYSRSRNQLWTKGETSGNYLEVKNILIDCDNDTILIQAQPQGPICHTGSETCFNEQNSKGYLYELEHIISNRISSNESNSYTNELYKKGINKIAQKVGEEAVELIIESKDNNDSLFKNEAADLLYHFLILLKAKEISLNEIENVLNQRAINPNNKQ